MSIGSLSSLWQQMQANAAAQASASSGTTSQSAQDWLSSLLSATGTQASTGGTASTATLSDQMQALLVQLQGGNTTVPDGAPGQNGATSATSSPTSTTEASSVHHHHHHSHGGGEGGVDQGTDDLATDAAGALTGSDATGLDSSSGGFMQSVTNMLETAGAAAAKGAVIAAM